MCSLYVYLYLINALDRIILQAELPFYHCSYTVFDYKKYRRIIIV